MNPVQLDIQQLRIKHILFKSKLRSVLYGGTYDETIFSEQGPVGQWFTTTGLPKYSTVGQMQQVYSLHLELNVLAKKLISLYRSNKIEEAHDGLRAVDILSEKFLELLSQLEENSEAAAFV